MPKSSRVRAAAAETAKNPRLRKKKSYHHSDLRQALLDAAVRELRTDDVSRLTMQRLARLIGVSAAAPYHHFDDLDTLLAGLATDGWRAWTARAVAAVATGKDADAQLLAMATAWLTFTHEHSAHYKVMLLPQLGDRARFADLHEASGASLAVLFDVLGGAVTKRDHVDLAARAVLVWSALHGFTLLRAGGVLDNIPEIPPSSRIATRVLRRLVSAALTA